MRIDKYILLTTSGKKVVFEPSSNKLHVYVPEKDDLFIKCVKNMADPEKRKKELIQKTQKASGKRAYPAFAIPISKAIDEVQGQFTKLTESTIEVPAATAPKDPPKKEEKGIPGYIQSGFNDVMSSVDKLNKTPIESPPTPPSVDFDYCYSCDPDRKAAYARDSAQFMKYLEPERSGMNKLVNVIHSIDLLKDSGYPYDSLQCANMLDKLYEGMQTVSDRIGNKLIKTWVAYNNDARKLPFLADQLLSYLRYTELAGLKQVLGFPDFSQISKKCVDGAKSALADALRENNYKILLNTQWIVSLDRMAELLGIPKEETETSLGELINMNRFKLSIDATARMSANGAIMAAGMKGDNIFRAVPDSKCILRWYLVEPSPDRMEFNLTSAFWHAGKMTPTYAGTGRWQSTPADIRLDFCKENRDTAFLFGFSALDGKESWLYQGREVITAVVPSTFISCFTDERRMKSYAADPSLQARLVPEIQEKAQKLREAMAKDPSEMTPEELANYSAAFNEYQTVMGTLQSMAPQSFLFKAPLRNNVRVVFDTFINGKQLYPSNWGITEAIFRVKIEHVEE